jgi:hypothetical protein
MAATVAAMEQYGFTPDELDAALVSANADLHSSTAKLKPIETAIREKKDLQKQVLAYAKTRDVRDGLKKQKTDKALMSEPMVSDNGITSRSRNNKINI